MYYQGHAVIHGKQVLGFVGVVLSAKPYSIKCRAPGNIYERQSSPLASKAYDSCRDAPLVDLSVPVLDLEGRWATSEGLRTKLVRYTRSAYRDIMFKNEPNLLIKYWLLAGKPLLWAR